MARPMKEGLAYFPLDTDFLRDRKIQRLFLRYRHEGVMTYITLLCEIYATNGYYIPYSDDLCLDVGFGINLPEEQVRQIVACCVEIHLFDKEKFDQCGVLTSNGLQRRFLEIAKRKAIILNPDYAITEGGNLVNATKTGILAAETPVIAAETPVIATITSPNINGNGNGNKNINTKRESENENRKLEEDGDDARMAELLKMAKEATGGC